VTAFLSFSLPDFIERTGRRPCIAVPHPRERIGGRGLLDTHTLDFLLLQTHTRRWAMKELLEMIAKALVDHPEEVNVRSVEGSQATILELRVHPEDLGKVIGRHGRTAEALRTIFSAAGMKLHKYVRMEIIE
jgi:predicted RNA-binding protein YlqC (UPF0109 family)